MRGAASQILTFRLQVRYFWTQTEIELVLSGHFEVLSFVSDREVRLTVWGHVASFCVHRRRVDVVGVVFRAHGPCVSFLALSGRKVFLIIGTAG